MSTNEDKHPPHHTPNHWDSVTITPFPLLFFYFLFFSSYFEPMGIFYQMQRGPLILIRPGHCIRQGFLVLMISDVSFVLSRSAHIT